MLSLYAIRSEVDRRLPAQGSGKGGERGLPGERLGVGERVRPRGVVPYAATSCGNLWGIVTAASSGGKIAVTGAVLRGGGVLSVVLGTADKPCRRAVGASRIGEKTLTRNGTAGSRSKLRRSLESCSPRLRRGGSATQDDAYRHGDRPPGGAGG